jgi:hypothetical protein
MGLTRKIIEYLNMATRGSFMYVSADKGRSILTKILQDLPKEREKLLEESQIVESESFPEPSSTSAILDPEPPEKEETPILNFMLEFEDELFDEYENTSNYHMTRKPQEPRKLSSHVEPLDPSEEAFLKNTTKELVSIMSNEWLEESELSPEVIV